TPPPDAGTPPPDAGTPPPDAGTPPPDAGTPPPDAGTPPPDAGTPPPDAGTPPPDAGTPSPDAGVVYITPANVTGDVIVSMDSHNQAGISRYIYGINFADQNASAPSEGLWGTTLPRYSLNRFGGNRLTAHNW